MNISEQIEQVCYKLQISKAELSRLLQMSPQSFNGMMKRESFTISELEHIAEVLDIKFEHSFTLQNGERIE